MNRIDKFKRWMRVKGLSSFTISQFSANVKKFLNEYGSLNSRAVQEFVDKQKGKDSKTIYSKYLSLKKYAEFAEYDLGNINYPKPRRNVNVIKTLSSRELLLLSNHIKSISKESGFRQMRDKVIMILLMLGLRRTEMLELRISDLDFENKRIGFVGKGNKGAFVPMMNQAGDIKNYTELRKLKNPREDNLLIYKYNNCYKSLKARELYKLLGDFTEQVIGRKANPHSWRHSIGTLMLEEGMDIRIVQETLRHASILTTQIYTHVSKKNVEEALENINPLFGE
ncbi:MAG: tyrosine-type recombinase/integrase [Candidatus Heimdallarchaeaceae archaeon]|jgi:site-specific recombinase XerD